MSNRSFTQLIEFEIEPRQQAALVSALATQTEGLAQRHDGFLSASVQASDDGRRVLSFLQWQSREAGEAAFRSFESGEEDFWQLIRTHRAKTVTFNSFQVHSSIARSHDDALHCRLPVCQY
ncbi:antibiotic biosynthesis monooxygenase [Pseudomonas moraviensis]|jgi:heme-degrading monooxygenase HmoA|uniref:antibiotic biosynthesis monooxygenase n=1 Tax=Pseudomonas moraviensis TaxID=321662 RepID=UPI0009368594|nr:antibiotic biosynthesis monooxygenase [Pseudomonas moraviensis]OJT51881.1 antibiotic biosynthesis monooxygenase [Pseudomonas moraviensis]